MNRRVVGLCAVSTVPQANKDEKVSLEEQERLIRERVAADGDVLVDMLIIPGFSRRYYTLYDLIEDADRAGYDAPRRLLEHIQRRDFDLLMCRYGSRFAREQSIFGEIVARIIDSGAAIFTLADGLIHAGNYRMYISMAGYAAATEVDRLVQGRKDAMQKRAARGLPTSSRIAVSHHLVRDEQHRPLRLEVNPARRRFLDDLAALLLAGVGFEELGNRLWEDGGHLSSAGRPYSSSSLHRLLRTPTFWGHTAQFYSQQPYGAWAYDEALEPPDGVVIHRHTHAAAYTGVLAEQVKNELRRREAIKVGRMNSHHTNPFTGLVVCAGCERRMIYQQTDRWTGYRCISTNQRYRHLPRAGCPSQPRSIRFEVLQDWVDAWLREILSQSDPLAFRLDAAADHADRAAALDADIAACEKRIAGLLLQRADTPPGSHPILSDLLRTEDTRLQTLRRQRDSLQRVAASQQTAAAAAAASADELRDAWARGFWSLAADNINRVLYGILGDWRFHVRDGVVVDFRPLTS